MRPEPVSAEQILVSALRLPSTGRTYRLLTSALNDPCATVDSVMDAVRLDGPVAARILRGANSAVFRRGEACRNLDEAIRRVGLREVSRLAGALVAERMFSDGLPIYRLKGETVWINMLASALAAERMAGPAGGDTKQAYTLGLLRSVGRLLVQRLALDLHLPEMGTETQPDTAAADAWEREHLGDGADQLGGRLLRMWEFPAEQEAALRHARKPAAHPERSPESALLHVACWVAEALGKGLPCEAGVWSLSPEILDQARLTEKQAGEAMVATRESLNRTLAVLQG